MMLGVLALLFLGLIAFFWGLGALLYLRDRLDSWGALGWRRRRPTKVKAPPS